MANLDNPSGLTPVRHLAGGEIRANEYSIAAAYGTAIFEGDKVKIVVADGRNIERCAAGDVSCGVFQGVHYVEADGTPVWTNQWSVVAGRTDIVATVFDDPLLVFEGQINGAFDEADINNTVNILATAGNTATGRSAEELDVSTAGDAGTTERLLGLAKNPSNEAGTNARVEIVARFHQLAPQATDAVV